MKALTGPRTLTCLHAFKWQCVLSNELVSNVVVIQHGEANQSQLRQVDLKLKALIKDRVVA